MSSREEFVALLRSDPESGFLQPETITSPQSKKKPPPLPILRHEQSPLLPPGIPPVSPRTPKQINEINTAPQLSRKHIRSSSDFAWTTSSADPSHPLKQTGLPPPHSRRPNKPPLRAITATPGTTGILGIHIPHPPPKPAHRSHRRSQSDLLKSVSFGAVITKSDLLKNFPDPRWAPQKNANVRKRTGSGDFLLEGLHSRGSSSGNVGYGSTGGSDRASEGVGRIRHSRTKSDMSFNSAVTDLTKSALVREITEGGRIRFQLPKDNFRILMDCTLETGNVYGRKLLDNEDSIFIDFHTEDTTPTPDCPCQCTCDRCHRCSSKQKALPPALFVMAVDSTLYRRMMNEIIESKAMPCGLFFCGHHEDVRYPDIKIAVAIVSVVLVCLILATNAFGGD